MADGQTNRHTDRRTEKATYRGTSSHSAQKSAVRTNNKALFNQFRNIMLLFENIVRNPWYILSEERYGAMLATILSGQPRIK